jgi:hypothetical protein
MTENHLTPKTSSILINLSDLNYYQADSKNT